jgi:hypothetical protein
MLGNLDTDYQSAISGSETNSDNLAIGRDVAQTSNQVTAAADVTRPAGPGLAENP